MVHRVAVLALDGVLPLDLGIPARVLNEACEPDGTRLYSVATCSIGGRPVRTHEDYAIVVDHDESLLESADTVVIATQEPSEQLLATGDLPDDVAAALDRIGPQARIVSLCTSAFLLAAAGLLDGRRATTHWALCDRLARLFPQVEVDPNVLFVDNGRILTSAGGAAGIDLCLHLVRLDHGAAVAAAAARRCVVAPWREGGQAQFIEHPVPQDTDRSTSATRQWVLDNLAQPITLEDMARRAHMSVRTFTRRFRSEVGSSPQKWLAQQRLAHARLLLETTELPVARVATACGFGDPVALRKHFYAKVGLSPLAYRRAHRAPESGAAS
ncbi:GlxA family transcriptional regulator [Actinotalea caeni]|uniref:GlxA family transcriptional regulator n=2 Tax=Actinotalea caeni TaxID=1348467 RepID=UPI0012E2F5DA|nr:helix-turn-helix domain-containing protein [Actinotalea caeni]